MQHRRRGREASVAFVRTASLQQRYTMTNEHDNAVNPEWWAEFEAARKRPFELHMKYAFIHTYKPILDDEPYRSFETTAEYRRWCNQHLPKWLGYGTD